MRTKYLLAAAAATLVAAVAFAAPGDTSGDRFAKLDSDGNGSVTRAEFDAHGAERFARIDANRDGVATQAEMKAHHEAMRAERAEKHDGDARPHRRQGEGRGAEGRARGFARHDTNADGQLTLAEFQARGVQRFERLDADRNGNITREEMAKAREAWKGRRRG